jgi:hypothetical protein
MMRVAFKTAGNLARVDGADRLEKAVRSLERCLRHIEA